MTDPILRDYQERDIQRLRNAYSHGMKAPIYQLATGGGKTVVFSAITKSATDKGKRTGVFVHRRELIKQASDKLGMNNVPHGIMAAGQDRDHDAPVQVLSIQSAINRTLPEFDFIVIDEAHHARAATWHALLAKQTKAKLLGVTATPARTDGKGLGVQDGGLFDAMVCGPSMKELVAAGHLAPARCLVPSQIIDIGGLKKLGGDYQLDQLAERASIVTGNAIHEFNKHAAGKTAIAFCCTVEHAEEVAASFRAAGLRSQCVHGGTPKVIRDHLIASLGTGEIDVLTSCDLISEGLDVPSVGAVILLRPTGSLILAMQQIGRGMRSAPGKDALIVLDHAGNTDRHGLPEDDRLWSLSGVQKARVERAPANPDTVGMGDPREIITVEGELVLAQAQADKLAKWARMSYGQFKKHPRTEVQVREFGKAHGYKPGWAFYFLKDQRERFALGQVAA